MRITLDEKQAKIASIALACFIVELKDQKPELEIKDGDWLGRWYDEAEKWEIIVADENVHVSNAVKILKKLNKEVE